MTDARDHQHLHERASHLLALYNNSLLSSYSNTKSCLIIVLGILFRNTKGFSSIFVAFKPSLEIINIMRPSSFICKRMGSLNHKMRMMLKKVCWPVLSNSRRRIGGGVWMILSKNPVCTILKLPM